MAMIRMDRRRLAKALARLRPYTGNSHPTHGLVRVEQIPETAEPPGLLLSCSNGREWASVLIAFEQGTSCDEASEVAVPLHLLHGFVSEATDETIEMCLDASGMRMQYSGASARLLGTPVETVNRLPVSVCDPTHMFARGDDGLCRAIRASISTVAPENSRYAIAGVRVERDGTVVSTNGRALQWQEAKMSVPDRVDESMSLLIPTKLAVEIGKWSHADLFCAPSHVYAVWDSEDGVWTAGTTHIEGSFPPWRSVVPELDVLAAISADGVALAKSVRQALPLVDRDIPRMVFRIAPDGVSISANAASGEARVEVGADITVQKSLPMEFAVSPHQLLELIDSACLICSEPIRIDVGARLKPLMLRSGDRWSAVLMPMVLA
jgi:hypothetical protein